MKALTALLLLLAFAEISFAQTRTFRWEDELCSYEGTYDARKITLAQLRNALKLARVGSGFTLETNTTVWKPSDIDKLDIAALDREYAAKYPGLKAIDLRRDGNGYWEDLRSRMLSEMEQVYRLERTTMLGYKDPRRLLDYKDAPFCTTKFADPLIAGGDDLLSAWLRVNMDSRKNNADPERLRRIYEQQLGSPDRMKFALIEVMAFGWSNCANALIKRVDYDGTQDKEFKKLFTRVRTLRCDQP